MAEGRGLGYSETPADRDWCPIAGLVVGLKPRSGGAEAIAGI